MTDRQTDGWKIIEEETVDRVMIKDKKCDRQTNKAFISIDKISLSVSAPSLTLKKLKLVDARIKKKIIMTQTQTGYLVFTQIIISNFS